MRHAELPALRLLRVRAIAYVLAELDEAYRPLIDSLRGLSCRFNTGRLVLVAAQR